MAISLQWPEPRSMSTAAVASTAAAMAGPVAGDNPTGTSSSLAAPMGMTEAAITIRLTPDTTGVMILRSRASQKAMAKWTRDAAATRLDIAARPTSAAASTQTAMKGAAGPISSRCPDPSRLSLAACRAVAAPPTISDAKTTHEA